jgi:DNA-binding transcriptional MerR regulator
MTISEAAEQTGLSTHTIRFYEHSGLLPRVRRSEAGVRQFSAADVTFLRFLVALKKTGLSLEAIAEYTADGCILERLSQGVLPQGSLAKRVAILEQHRRHLCDQRREIDMLIDAVDQKLTFFARYLTVQEGTQESEGH